MSHLVWLIFALIMTVVSAVFSSRYIMDGDALNATLWGIGGTIWISVVIVRAILLGKSDEF
jgi:hypothetical protein